MIKLELVRDVRTTTETLGWLNVGAQRWPTIERSWFSGPGDSIIAGRKGVSCVPIGTYRLERHDTEAHPNTWALVNHDLFVYHWPWEVPASLLATARTTCLIHSANWASELRGCIAPGLQRLLTPNKTWMVKSSLLAMTGIHIAIGNESNLELSIINSEQVQDA